jgi:2-keto-4-pentenoate hydratase/GNAT superfamily N-acetyltransferase
VSLTIAAARADDLTPVLALLADNDLPADGLAAHLGTALVARIGDAVVGAAAVEPYGAEALLHSVAVEAAHRRRGVGRGLTLAALDLARRRGVRRLWLLTETAGAFFSRLGFYTVPRAALPEALHRSPLVTAVCPASARVMRSLTPDVRIVRGMCAQLDAWRTALARGAARVGWKISLNQAAVQQKLWLDGPVVGYLTTATALAPGAAHSLAGGTRVGVEPEIAIEIGADLPPAATPELACAAISGIGPALEVIDLERPLDDLEHILTSNRFHRAAVLGTIDHGRAGGALGGIVARATRNHRVVGEVQASAALDLAAIVRLVADTLGAFGERLMAGDRIISGSLTRPLWVAPGDVAGADFGPLGSLAVEFIV